MQVVRLNMSHGDHKSHKAVVDLVKEYNRLNRNSLAVMLDTKGPEVRSGDLAEPIEMKPGDTLSTQTGLMELARPPKECHYLACPLTSHRL